MKTANRVTLQFKHVRVSAAKKRAIDARLASIQKKLKKHKWDSAEEVRKMRLRWSS